MPTYQITIRETVFVERRKKFTAATPDEARDVALHNFIEEEWVGWSETRRERSVGIVEVIEEEATNE